MIRTIVKWSANKMVTLSLQWTNFMYVCCSPSLVRKIQLKDDKLWWRRRSRTITKLHTAQFCVNTSCCCSTSDYYTVWENNWFLYSGVGLRALLSLYHHCLKTTNAPNTAATQESLMAGNNPPGKEDSKWQPGHKRLNLQLNSKLRGESWKRQCSITILINIWSA